MKLINETKNFVIGNIYGIEKLSKAFNKQTKFIVVSGSPRSGTTFLAETIMSRLKGMIIWEPLQDKVLSLKKLDIPKRPQLQDIVENKKLKTYLDNLSSGKDLNIFNTWIRNKKFRLKNNIKSYDYVLIKFTRGNGIIDYFKDKKYVVKVSIVRNPYSVIASQIEHHEFKEHPIYSEKFPDIKKIELVKSRIEQSLVRDLAITWCVDYKNAILSDSMNFKYEDLIDNIDILKKIRIGNQTLKFKPSISSTYNKQTSNYGSFKDKWKRTLTKNDAKIITQVLEYIEIEYKHE